MFGNARVGLTGKKPSIWFAILGQAKALKLLRQNLGTLRIFVGESQLYFPELLGRQSLW